MNQRAEITGPINRVGAAATMYNDGWRNGRAVEGGGLENR